MGWSLEMLMSDEQEASFLIVYKTKSSPRDSPTRHTSTYLPYLPIMFSENDKEIRREERGEGGEQNIAAIELLKQYVRLHPLRSSCLFRAAFESR